MEFGSVSREIRIEATPEVVYQVISRPEHLREWWPDEAELEAPVPGGTGTVTFGSGPEAKSEVLTVVEADPPRRFSFRWVCEDGATAGPGNSLLVTFDLEAVGEGTLLRFSESGFRERGWEAAVLEQAYRDHASGWDHFLPRLVDYAAKAAVR
ncbi:SRPBCC domain-containing protein [Streptomyces sp. t39]|uniref:SRPBCC domain-containing protein n=1 Tax=Streptomyces sp. t39 TaxID=1828156 RepID=UPI0011CEBBC2|nr:SRPBCC domain-containing protein [Streptomyces sp. t39]TXS54180.1 polyketide cyclase [Streptomyces sp. t39]